MIVLFGAIPLGIDVLTGPIGQSIERTATFAQHPVTRGKPALQEIGEELDTQTFDFFFSEEFCEPAAELGKLEAAFALKTPLPLVLGNGVYFGKRYVVEALSIGIVKTTRAGAPVRRCASRRRSACWSIRSREACSRSSPRSPGRAHRPSHPRLRPTRPSGNSDADRRILRTRNR